MLNVCGDVREQYRHSNGDSGVSLCRLSFESKHVFCSLTVRVLVRDSRVLLLRGEPLGCIWLGAAFRHDRKAPSDAHGADWHVSVLSADGVLDDLRASHLLASHVGIAERERGRG